MLFDYSRCEECKKHKAQLNDIKLTLCNKLPPQICNAIGEYGGCCEKCTEMKLNEKEFMKQQKNSNLDKFELQIKFFRIYHYNKMPIEFYSASRQTLTKQINDFYSNEGLVERFGGERYVKPDRAFVKQNRELFKYLDLNLTNRTELINLFRVFEIKERVFFHYNIGFSVENIVKLFIIEFLYAIIGEDYFQYFSEDLGDMIVEHYDPIFEEA